jgi:hypothetical protein
MSLQFTNIPVLFSGGLDQKTAEQLVVPGKFLVLENCVRRKLGKIQKRFGFDTLSTTITGSTDLITSGRKLAKFREDLVQFTDNNMYSYSSSNDEWVDKGQVTSVLVDSEPLVRNSFIQATPDVASKRGVTVTVWSDSRGGVRCAVYDDTTGASILYDTVVSSVGSRPKVLAVGDYFVIAYRDSSNNNLSTRRIAINVPNALEAEVVAVAGTTIDAPWDMDLFNNAAFFAFNNATDITVGYIAESGDIGSPPVNGLPGSSSIAFRGENAVDVVCDQTNNRCYVHFHDDLDDDVKVAAFTSDLLTQVIANIEANILDIRNITGTVREDFSVRVFYEQSAASVKNHLVRTSTYTFNNIAVTPGTPAEFKRSVGLGAKAFTIGPDEFVTVTHESELQSTYFTVKSDGYIVTRMLQGTGGGLTRGPDNALISSLGRMQIDTAGRYIFPIQIRNQLTADLGGTVLSSSRGIQKAALRFGDAAYNNDSLGENLHISGGILLAYDGVSATEHGYNLYPEDVVISSPSDYVTPEVFTWTSPTFAASAQADYAYITAQDGTTYAVWLDKDAANIPPTGALYLGADFEIEVEIVTGDTAAQVAGKVRTALLASSDWTSRFTTSVVTGAAFTVTQLSPGDVQDPVRRNADDSGNGSFSFVVNTQGGTGSLPAGQYAYRAIYEWVDGRGQIHRSAPSILDTITVGAGSAVDVYVPTLRLTLKTLPRAECKVVIYRSLADQVTVLYRLAETNNDTSVDTVVFTDTGAVTDATLATQEILYTTGGVLENIAAPASKVITKHKNRLWLAGLENESQLAYSKEYVNTEGVAFSDFFTIQCDPRGGQITALASMDDKLIIFKRDQVFSLVGDGPVDTGAQNDYSKPQGIAGDIGCIQPESIASVPDGLLFKSDKGIYKLTRSLGFEYVGSPVEDFNALTISSATVLEDNNEVRFTTSDGQALIYNYFFDQWSTFTNYVAVSGINALGSYLHLRSDGQVRREVPGLYLDAGGRIRMAIETSWLAFAGLQGYQRIRRFDFLGDYLSDHYTRVKIAYDYEDAYVETVYFNVDEDLDISYYGDDATYGSSTVYGGPGTAVYQFSIKPRKQKSEAMKLRFEDIDTKTADGGGSFNLVGITFEVGQKIGTDKQFGGRQR